MDSPPATSGRREIPAGSPPGTGGVARSAGVVAQSKSFPSYSYHPSGDLLRDPAALLSWEGSLFILTSNQTTTHFTASVTAQLEVGQHECCP
jgi:hypothetical protein